MKRTGFNRYIYDFSVDYDATDVDNIKNIHKYLMKRMELYKTYRFIKKIFISALIYFGNL